MIRSLRYRAIVWIRGTSSISLLDELRNWQYQRPEILTQRQQDSLQDYFAELRHSVSLFSHIKRFEDLPVHDKRFIIEHCD